MGRRKKERLKVYIAGKVSGLPYEEVRANFARHAAYARRMAGRKAHIVLPTVICRQEWSWWHCMWVCLRALRTCDVAYFMPNWKQSRGARIEYFLPRCGASESLNNTDYEIIFIDGRGVQRASDGGVQRRRHS